MRTDLCVRAVHQGDMRVNIHIREHMLPMDYPAQMGRDPTPLEMLMASLAACAANTLNLVLCKKMGVRVDSLEVEVRAERQAEHPTVLSDIEMVYHLNGDPLDPPVVDRAVRIAENQLCPVLAMLRPRTSIHSSWVAQSASVHG